MNKRVSIITINFNNLSGLEKTVPSVLTQTYDDYEYILIDGASTDGSVAYLDKYNAHFSTLISEKDSGIYNAMNKGIAAATGDYLLFLHSGDALTSNTALQTFIDDSNFKGDIMYGDYKFETGGKVYPDTVSDTFFMRTSLPHQSTLFKKQVFDKIGNYDESYRLGADREFYIKCHIDGAVKFSHVPFALTLFDLTGMSNNPSYTSKKRAEDERMLLVHFGEAYTLFLEEVKLERAQKAKQRNSLKGILKRVKNKLFK